jgi:hypothetical protein
MISNLIRDVEQSPNHEMVPQLVNAAWPKIVEIPQAQKKKDLMVETMVRVWETRKRPRKHEKNSKVSKVEVKELLDRIRMTISNDEFQRTLSRVNGSSDIEKILARTYCFAILSNQGMSAINIATALGSKSEKNLISSSVFQNARALHHLIIRCNMHKLTRTSPTRDDLHSLLTQSTKIEEYLANHPEEQAFWSLQNVQNTLAWFIGSN